jgi:hypothetical protein
MEDAMAVDFKKLRDSKAQQRVIDPIEIFRRLPKSARIKDSRPDSTAACALGFCPSTVAGTKPSEQYSRAAAKQTSI